MLDERDPIFRAALAPFEDARYRRQAIVAEIDREFDQRATDLAKANAERDKQSEQQLSDLTKMAGDRKSAQPEQQSGGWERKERRTMLSFGDDDQPSPPGSLPRPAPRPVPSPPQEAPALPASPAPERYLSFGAVEDDPPAPPASPQSAPRQAPRRAAPPPEDDDDDFSGHSWVR
ncbi:hypothetical protein [Actinokineospora sp.]|uniref:hypothetical protein n=1 Tax=Actinokineospora sp. TaxID=1872133 RepID=UPI003D6BE6BF